MTAERGGTEVGEKVRRRGKTARGGAIFKPLYGSKMLQKQFGLPVRSSGAEECASLDPWPGRSSELPGQYTSSLRIWEPPSFVPSSAQWISLEMAGTRKPKSLFQLSNYNGVHSDGVALSATSG